MRHFFIKLLPPRTTFISDMTAAEASLMKKHSGYWRGLLTKNVPVVFGPVIHPKGAFGVCVFRAADEAEAHAVVVADSTIRPNAGFAFELFPMGYAVYRE